MRPRFVFCASLVAICFAGCSTGPKQAPVWEDLHTIVESGPQFPVAGPVEGIVSSPSTPPPTAPPVTINETWVPAQRWSRTAGLALPVSFPASPSTGYALRSTNGTFMFHAGSHIAQWDGVEIRLGFAPQIINGQPYLHAIDLHKTVEPLLLGAAQSWSGNAPVIVIDPGHGGVNPGTQSVLSHRCEKEFTLDWALRLQSLLRAQNCQVFLTRTTDVDLALSNRVACAGQHKADIFISLHFNSAAPNKFEQGLETYCLTPAGLPSSVTRGYSDELNQAFPNNAFDVPNLQLALKLHRALLEVNGHHDRGIRRARFPGVLRGQQRAAVLVEGGYLSNPQEARLIEQPEYRQKLAQAIAHALLTPAEPGRPLTFASQKSTDSNSDSATNQQETRGTATRDDDAQKNP